MSQSTFDDDELFGEAADEMREDVETSLSKAHAELPTAESVWETSADNVLGVLNGLKSALDVGEAADHLRQAKKWYTLGSRAEAFEDPDDLEAEIEAVEELLETVERASDDVSELTGTIPQLRGALEDAQTAAESNAADAADETDDADEKSPSAETADADD